ncbi:hypothetical protein [Streptosporangium sp. NPDC006007]|uniref:hypothetical protein n=1 Tax=Streptosporangium sp. NPDC006007 TaxID=3154575 RepID=UPI0033A3A739
MTPDAAAWVREHVLTHPAASPNRSTECACQVPAGTCGRCRHGQHGRCRAAWGFERPLRLGHCYVSVWLADRICKTRCICRCRTAPALPTAEQLALI